MQGFDWIYWVGVGGFRGAPSLHSGVSWVFLCINAVWGARENPKSFPLPSKGIQYRPGDSEQVNSQLTPSLPQIALMQPCSTGRDYKHA